MRVEIINATLEDIDKGLLEVYIEGYKYHKDGRPDIFVELSNEELRKNLIDDFGKFTTIVLLKDEEIVGYLSYRIKENYLKKLDVDQLIVKESCRHMGFGKKLMDEAKNIAKEIGCDRIELNCWLFNQNALDMYEHIGYKRQRIIYEYKID